MLQICQPYLRSKVPQVSASAPSITTIAQLTP